MQLINERLVPAALTDLAGQPLGPLVAYWSDVSLILGR